MTRSMKVAAAAIVTVLALLLYPRSDSPATSKVLATPTAVGGGSPTALLVPGAPQTSAHAEAQGRAEETTGGAPHPFGGIGNPVTFWKPGYKPRPTPPAKPGVRVVVSKGTAEPIIPSSGGVSGFATYYGSSEGWTGAINHRLGHVGQVAVVCGGEPFHCRSIQIVDVCACGDRSGSPTLIDLSPFAFQDFAPLSRGVVRISMEVLP